MSVVIVKRGFMLLIFQVCFLPLTQWCWCDLVPFKSFWISNPLAQKKILYEYQNLSRFLHTYIRHKKYSLPCSSFTIILDYPYKKRHNVHSKRDSLRHYHMFCFVFFGTSVSVFSGMSSCQIRDIWSDNINNTGDKAEYIGKDNHVTFLYII